MADEGRGGEGPQADRPESSWQNVLVSYRWPLALVALALVALAFYLVTLRQAQEAAGEMGELIGATADRAESVARNCLTADVTELFIASIPEVATGGSGRLELATAEVTETFTRSDERRILWDSLSLGITVTEIKVPVTYRYHVRLDDSWELEASGPVCVVRAPELRPSLPPAIHSEGLQRLSRSTGWLPADAEEGFDELERSLTPILTEYARDERHLAAARAEGRKTIARFVRSWLRSKLDHQDER